jgi:hypothetical protein
MVTLKGIKITCEGLDEGEKRIFWKGEEQEEEQEEQEQEEEPEEEQGRTTKEV